MGQKFDKIWESVASRHTSGGYLPGDFVTFRKTYKSADCYKSLPTKIQKDLDELVKSGLNIRVTQVGNNLGGHSAQNQNKTTSSAVITVAGDHGGGCHYGMIAVSPDMIDLVEDDYPKTGKVPDQFKRKEKITIKPEPYKADDKHITRVTDKGNGKNTPTQLKLAGESTIFKNSMLDMAMIYESMNVNMDDPKDLMLHIRHAKKTGDVQKVKSLTDRLRKVAMRLDMLDDPDILDVIGNFQESKSPLEMQLIYEQYLSEGFLRRMATKLAGGFKSNPMVDNNRIHQFAKSVSLDAGKDIAKSFGGDFKTHADFLYNSILEYLKKNTAATHTK